ncbi:MAG: M10 family metallopeptidase [Microvirga sp.]
MAGIVAVPRSNDQDVNGLLSGYRWSATSLSYSFPGNAAFYESGYGSGEPKNHFEALNKDQAGAARSALAAIASVTRLTFGEIGESAGTHAVLRLAMSDVPPGAWTYTIGAGPESADTWFGNTIGWYDAPVRGNYAYYAFLHEIGHSLGLKHGNEIGGFGALSEPHDSMEYSVMTYRSYPGASVAHVENEAGGYAQSYMMSDIAALQAMYGASYGTRSGDTTYAWDQKTGQWFIDGVGQGLPAANRIFMTVWDGGGTDTYDFSRYTIGLTVDLQPGHWSKTAAAQTALLGEGHPARGNIANALLHENDARALIENAVGGSFRDRLTGNATGNLLKGMDGQDVLKGLAGDDTLVGGAGNDEMSGGSGRDAFVFDGKLEPATNLDRLLDFSVADDVVHLSRAAFSKAGPGGKLADSAFWSGPKAHDASDRIVYDPAAGTLQYDADGTGKAAPVAFALMSKNLKMTAADFFLV